jgi:CheY-like chemotaxis protein
MILVIDDEKIILELTGDILSEEGLSHVCKVNGEEALEFLRDHGEECTLILMDMVLPGLCGSSLISQISEYTSAPIIVTTGYEIEDAEVGSSPQVVDYLQKPYQLERMLSAVKQQMTSSAGL